MKAPRKYQGIISRTRELGIPDKQTIRLIRTFREEFLSEPSSLGDLLEVLE